MQLLRITAAAVMLSLVAGAATGADPARKAFADSWRGKRLAVKRTLFTLVYNERGKLGKIYRDRREGLVVTTPSAGSFLQFDGRDGEQDIAAREPQQIIDRIGESYRRQESLEIGFYLRIEPQIVVRYEPGGALAVREVRVERSRVRLLLGSVAADAPADQIATGLTVQWPADFSPAFTEAPLVEGLIRQYVE